MTELVTQADREAAYEHAVATGRVNPIYREAILRGEWDSTPDVLAFARHRISSANEAIEEAAKIADRARDTVYVQPTDWDYGALDACHAIARDIRALKSGSASHG